MLKLLAFVIFILVSLHLIFTPVLSSKSLKVLQINSAVSLLSNSKFSVISVTLSSLSRVAIASVFNPPSSLFVVFVQVTFLPQPVNNITIAIIH